MKSQSKTLSSSIIILNTISRADKESNPAKEKKGTNKQTNKQRGGGTQPKSKPRKAKLKVGSLLVDIRTNQS